MSRKLLLTGAGFTHNFRLPLARHVWGMIFNDPHIQKTKNVKNSLKETYNYEDLYSRVLTDDEYTDDRKVFLTRIDEVFNDIFETLCVKAINSEIENNIKFNDLRKFIKLFSGRAGNTTPYIFSLNQDLFLERLFMLENSMLFSPFLGNCLWNFNPTAQQQGVKMTYGQLVNLGEKIWNNHSDGVVPTTDGLREKKTQFDIRSEGANRKFPFYIKLHGSIGWRYSENNGNIPLVMGIGKSEQIKGHPLLQHYFDIFTQAICEKDTALLVIGYSFSDYHVNKIIAHAIEKNKINLHVIDPQPINKFRHSLKINAKKNADTIFKGLCGYYEGTLSDIFPYVQASPIHDIIQSQTLLWNQINKNFFRKTG